MATTEFELIRTYFSTQGAAPGVELGIGDDCALLCPSPGELLAVTVDTLVGGVHFPAHGAPEQIGQRALRVNLSDLAAMGAQPRWALLALTLPAADEDWLAGFSRGLRAAATQWGVALVGGDTTRGPISITLTLMGAVSAEQALRRDGARVGDRIYVTGTLGDGAGGLAALNAPELTDLDYLRQRYWRPTPRVAEGQLLRALASAAIDVSDGLIADLGHIAARSGVGAHIQLDQLPLAPALTTFAGLAQARTWALCGGDDYELCFTVSPDHLAAVETLIATGQLTATAIGEVVTGAGVVCQDGAGRPLALPTSGYRHF